MCNPLVMVPAIFCRGFFYSDLSRKFRPYFKGKIDFFRSGLTMSWAKKLRVRQNINSWFLPSLKIKLEGCIILFKSINIWKQIFSWAKKYQPKRNIQAILYHWTCSATDINQSKQTDHDRQKIRVTEYMS